MNELNAEWCTDLERLRAAGLHRQLTQPAGLDFCSNDYLGHSRHPQVIAVAERALHLYGAGTPAARGLRGHIQAHAEVEQVAAEWQQTEAALLLPSGYQANLALLSTLPQAGDVVFSDQLNHASLIDGCRLSRADVQVFAHNDLTELQALLDQAQASPGRRWIVTERVFSMDGDQAPVEELLSLCEQFDAYLLLDEAHAAGIYPILPPHPRLVSRLVTGGKALGVSGGLICGSQAMIDTLINRARNFIFTTANSPVVATALTASIRLLQAQPQRVAAIHENAAFFRRALSAIDFGLDSNADCPQQLGVLGSGPIVPIVFGDADRTMEVAAKVQAAGFDVRGVRPPTVPQGSSRLRIVIHADHTRAQLDSLAAALNAACNNQVQAAAPVATDHTGNTSTAAHALAVCGTDTDVGKTILSALMMLQYERAGIQANYLKPVQTGSDSDTETVKQLAALQDEQAPRPVVELDLPASIDQAAEFEKRHVSAAEVVDGVRQKLAAEANKQWLLELAGGLLVPLNQNESQADVLQQLGYPVVLAARAALGTLNHTLLTVEALRSRGVVISGIMVIGGKHPGNLKSLRTILSDIPVIEVPHFDHLSTRHLRTWVEEGKLDAVVPPVLAAVS